MQIGHLNGRSPNNLKKTESSSVKRKLFVRFVSKLQYSTSMGEGMLFAVGLLGESFAFGEKRDSLNLPQFTFKFIEMNLEID